MAQRNHSVSPKPGKSRQALTLTHPNAAGIDIGSASHYVAVPPDRDDEPVREFASFTVDLHKLADWLEACGIDTVAMESTGVYWIARACPNFCVQGLEKPARVAGEDRAERARPVRCYAAGLVKRSP